MEDLEKKIEQEMINITRALNYIKGEQNKEPQGSLRISNRKEGPRFYHRFKDDSEDKMVEQYLSKHDHTNLITQLAQKQYLHSLKPILEQELQALQRFQKQYIPERKDAVYDHLTPERKKLVRPLFQSAEEQFQKWKEEEYKRFEGFPEKLIFETERGELVRSKSELIIADQLFKEKSRLHYRYEGELYLRKSNQFVHPDFTIMKRKSAEIIYWEHAGMMDDSEYADRFVWKINTYIKEGYIPGKDLIITYETSEFPLDVAVVRKMIKEYF